MKNIWRKIASAPIRAYQLLISPLFPASCIYIPSCSEYTRQSVLKHGLLRGIAAGILRIGRCSGGLYCGGEDPVPEKILWQELFSEYKKRWKCRHSNKN